jgi:hypothetical protein
MSIATTAAGMSARFRMAVLLPVRGLCDPWQDEIDDWCAALACAAAQHSPHDLDLTEIG